MLNDKIHAFIGTFVVLSTIFLWSIELGPRDYDVGLNVYISVMSLVVFFPYIIRRFDVFPFVFSLSIVLYQLVWTSINGFDMRSMLTCICFVLYFYGVFYSVLFCLKDNFCTFREVIIPFLTAQICLQALQIFDVFSLYDFSTVKIYILGSIGGTGFYGEGSHVGFSLVPLMFLKDNRGSHFNLYSILVGFSLLLGISSTAVLGVLLICVLLMLRSQSWVRIAMVTSVIVGFLAAEIAVWRLFSVAPITPLATRIWGFFQILGGDISPRVSLSSLVYVNGVDMAWSGLKDIIGSGLGHFNVYHADSIARTAIDKIIHGPLNKDDGSVVLLKMIGEMGLFGLAIVIYFVFNSLSIINKYGDSILSVIACFLIMAAIRSAGYFHGPYILSFALVGVLWQLNRTWPNGTLNQQTDLNNTMPQPAASSPSDR